MPYTMQKWDRPHPLNRAAIRVELEAQGFTVYQWTERAGTVHGIHKHDTDQCHWIVSGCLELTVVGAGTFLLEAGDRDHMPAGTLHSARVPGDEPVIYVVGERPVSEVRTESEEDAPAPLPSWLLAMAVAVEEEEADASPSPSDEPEPKDDRTE